MSLKKLLSILKDVADENNISTPYIVGGVPRNILLKDFDSLNDIDVTTGNEDIHRLADLFAQRMGTSPKIFDDGHRRVYVDDFQIDFSSNAAYKGVDKFISGAGKPPSDILRDIFSRDFTVNTLLLPLDFSEIIDLTGKGKDDLKNKVLRCPIDCNIIFSESPNRIVRAFYYAAKFDLKLADEVKEAIKNNLDLLNLTKGQYSSKKIAEALKLKPQILDELIETGVLSKIPLTKEVVDILVKEKKLHGAL